MNKYIKSCLSKIIIFVYLIIIFQLNIYANTLTNKKFHDSLIQLEHISNAHSQCLSQIQQQLLKIEQDMDNLRGQIQENEHQLLKIIKKQNDIINEIDLFIRNNTTNVICNNDRFFSKNKKDVLNIKNKDHQDIIDYNKAVNLVLHKKQYEEAIRIFQNFILEYPNSIYQANAHYWLGQLNYRKGKKNDASYHFSLVAKNYPKSLKAADALLKVGIILEEQGCKDEANLIYKQVNHLYPGSDASKQSNKRSENFSKTLKQLNY